MNKPDLEALLEDLQSARQGEAFLDEQTLLAVGYSYEEREYTGGHRDNNGNWHLIRYWFDRKGQRLNSGRPSPTRNTQDALDCMVPEGWYLCDMNAGGHGALAVLRRYQTSNDDIKDLSVTLGHTQTAAKLALAICSACIEQLIGECDDT